MTRFAIPSEAAFRPSVAALKVEMTARVSDGKSPRRVISIDGKWEDLFEYLPSFDRLLLEVTVDGGLYWSQKGIGGRDLGLGDKIGGASLMRPMPCATCFSAPHGPRY